jgi:hypothetical protein
VISPWWRRSSSLFPFLQVEKLEVICIVSPSCCTDISQEVFTINISTSNLLLNRALQCTISLKCGFISSKRGFRDRGLVHPHIPPSRTTILPCHRLLFRPPSKPNPLPQTLLARAQPRSTLPSASPQHQDQEAASTAPAQFILRMRSAKVFFKEYIMLQAADTLLMC